MTAGSIRSIRILDPAVKPREFGNGVAVSPLDFKIMVNSYNKTKQLMVQEVTTWYDKQGELTFSDILITIRRSIWKQRYFSKSANNPELIKIEEQYEKTFLYQLALAA